MSTHADAEKRRDVPRLDSAASKKLLTVAGVFAGASVLVAAAGALVDPHRFAFAYLVGFCFAASLGLGGLFFVIIQHLTKAGWSVAARRHMEWMSAILPACIVLFIPVALFAPHTFEPWMGHEAATDPVLSKKLAYLNPTFFFVRAGFYLLAWAGLAHFFSSKSAQQDGSGDKSITQKLEGASAPAVIVFALTTTFAAFDWLMSLDPHWYSTIFGVYYFAGAALSSLAALSLITITLQKKGYLSRVSTVEHRHDIGKLFFGFVVFWAYIAFSQFILIWYANIPEETIFYKHRWDGSWKYLSWTLLFGHFVIPFVVLMSRHAKRSYTVLGATSVFVLLMHWVDLYWLVMPNMGAHGGEGHGHDLHVSWVDVAGLLGPLGVSALAVAFRATRTAIYPLKDPRIPETVRVENL